MCIFKINQKKEKETIMSSKPLKEKAASEIQIKKIGFSSQPITHRVQRMGKNDIITSGGKTEIVTPKNIRELRNRTVKIRFSGVPRARIGEIITDAKGDSSSVFIRTTRSRSSKKISHYDVLIVKDK